MTPYESLNYLDFDHLLTEEELMIRQTVRDFATQEILPKLQEANRQEKFPMELVPRFGELGLLGSTIKGYHCPGLGDVAYGLLMQELERADSGIRSFCSVQGALVMYPIDTYGTEAQKQKYLPPMAKGELIGCFGLTEPDAGSNPGGNVDHSQESPRGLSTQRK